MLDKIKKASSFNQGYIFTEALAAAELDMQWHTIPDGAPLQDVDKFEAEALRKTNLNLSYFLRGTALAIFCTLAVTVKPRVIMLTAGLLYWKMMPILGLWKMVVYQDLTENVFVI